MCKEQINREKITFPTTEAEKDKRYKNGNLKNNETWCLFALR